MKIITADNKEKLNEFVAVQPRVSFLQSWEWGEFQEKISGRVWRIGVEDDGRLVASAKIIEKVLPMGKRYFYCARGPVVSAEFKGDENKTKEAYALLFMEIERLAKDEKVMFLRFDPLEKWPIKAYSAVKTHNVQPHLTIYLDLSLSEEELLKKMHQKTRYNINLADKKGVKIVEGKKEQFEDFWRLLDQTSGRDKFRPHGRNYYQAMLDLSSDFLKLFFAEYNGKLIAAGLFIFFGDSAIYLHGGSANEDRNVMAPFLLQWHAIKLAKSQGRRYYDFHGIDEKKYPGVTRFKRGFGGEEHEFPGTHDLVYDPGWYSVYKMVRKVRRTF